MRRDRCSLSASVLRMPSVDNPQAMPISSVAVGRADEHTLSTKAARSGVMLSGRSDNSGRRCPRYNPDRRLGEFLRGAPGPTRNWQISIPLLQSFGLCQLSRAPVILRIRWKVSQPALFCPVRRNRAPRKTEARPQFCDSALYALTAIGRSAERSSGLPPKSTSTAPLRSVRNTRAPAAM